MVTPHVLGIAKANERYVLVYGHGCRQAAEALRAVARWASNPELTFGWEDAEGFGQKIRQIANEASERARRRITL